MSANRTATASKFVSIVEYNGKHIGFNRETQQIECGCCNTAMSFDQGIFALPFTAQASFADAMTCPNCGDSLDIQVVWDVLESTPRTQRVARAALQSAAWQIKNRYDAIVELREVRALWWVLNYAERVGNVRLVTL